MLWLYKSGFSLRVDRGLKNSRQSSCRTAKLFSCPSKAGWNRSRPQKLFDLLLPGSGLKWRVNEGGMSFHFVNLFCYCNAKGLWCDMTADCFKCPHQQNGWMCLGATTTRRRKKKAVRLHYTQVFTVFKWTAVGAYLEKNECACVTRASWCKRIHPPICWCDIQVGAEDVCVCVFSQ